MADGVELNTGSGGSVVATDQDGSSMHHQYVKIEFGADNTFTKVTTSVGLPSDPLDRSARDLGKVDVAALDQYTPLDIGNPSLSAPSEGSPVNALPVVIVQDGLTPGDTPVFQTNVTDVVPGFTATKLGKKRDVAAGAADVGVAAMAVRADSGGPFCDTTGDYAPLITDAQGYLWVAVGNIVSTTVGTIAAGSNLIGDVGLQSRTTGGDSAFFSIDIDETEEDVKVGAATLTGYYLWNTASSSWRYFHFYNAAAAGVTVGTTAPLFTVAVPPASAANLSKTPGIAFSTAISLACTNAADGTGSPGSNECGATVWYK